MSSFPDLFVLRCTAEEDAGDDCQDAGPDATAGGRRGGWPSHVNER